MTYAHTIPLGTEVLVTKFGQPQWRDQKVVVFRHDRNLTYRLKFDNDTFVTAHEDELAIKEVEQ